MITIDVKSGSAGKSRDDAVVIPLLAGRRLSASGQEIQEASNYALRDYLRKFDQAGDFGDFGMLYHVPGMLSPRLALIGVEEEKKLTLAKLRQLAAQLARRLDDSGARDIAVYLPELNVRGSTIADRVRALAEGVWLGLYRFDKYQTEKKASKRPLRKVTLMLPSRRDLDPAGTALAEARAACAGTLFARDIANEPGNVCTPAYLGEQALTLKHAKLEVTVMDKAAIIKAGFKGLLAVSQGSSQEPRFIILEYRGGGKDDAPVALVGKGLTFDAGGISLKPPKQMDEMKFDMCGAAAVLGIVKAVCEMNLPVNILGVIAAAENLPGGTAYKPGDILSSYKGVTIEVLNTDAEGRIVLADALAYASEQKPAAIVDFATLTGACVIALGAQASGLMGNNEGLLAALERSGQDTYDRVWRLPLFEEYQEQIKSEIADIKNTGGREAGTITAACFLSRFVDDIPWAHLDIAGTAWNMKGSDIAAKGATGAGVRLLVQYLARRAA